ARNEGKRIFYTTPIKALSNQKFNDLCEVHGAENVGLLTGDTSIRRDAPIIVMTTEVLRNMLYNDVAGPSDLGIVVLDEVHYLADRVRLPVWDVRTLPTASRWCPCRPRCRMSRSSEPGCAR